MVKVTIEVLGAAEAAQLIRAVDARVNGDLRPLLSIIGEDLASQYQQRIADGSVELPELSAATKAIRKYYGHDGKQKLIRSGDLLHSIRTLRIGDASVDVGTDMEWPGATAKTLHDGGIVTDKHGRTHTVPAFPFLATTATMLDDVQTMVADYFVPETAA